MTQLVNKVSLVFFFGRGVVREEEERRFTGKMTSPVNYIVAKTIACRGAQ